MRLTPASILLLAAAYYVAAELGLALVETHGNVSPVWPPTGIAIAGLLILGARAWPAVAVGAFVANLGTGVPAGVALGIGAGNTLEALTAVFLLQRVGFRNALERVHDVVALVLLAAFLSPIVSATIGVASLNLGGVLQGAGWSHLWFVWWAGDAGGALLVTPVLLTVHEVWRRGADWRRLREALPAAIALSAVCALVFRLDLIHSLWIYPLEYAVLPVLFWIALRFGQAGSTTAILMVAASAIWGTLDGIGPFTGVSWEESIWLQQAFLGVVGITVMVVTAVIAERRSAEGEIRALNEHLEKRVGERTALLEAAIERRERAEEQSRRHQAHLAHVLRVQTMGEMAAGLAHEINQPLGAIANYAQGCRRRIASGSLSEAELMAMLDSIAAEALRAGETIRHLRTLVRKQESQREPTDLNRIVHDAVELTEPDTRASGVTLRLELADRLPPVIVDRVQIEQVVLNLLRNAVEAMHDCRGDALLTVATRADGAGSVEVTVVDTGIGLPADGAALVFEPFITDKKAGLGMGLAISRSIVELHGGRIWAEPNGARGATFRFTLPGGSPDSPDRRTNEDSTNPRGRTAV